MSKWKVFCILLTGCAIQLSFSANAIIMHNELEPVVKGDKARFDLNLMSLSSDLYEARLFYRAKGDADYRSKVLSEAGYNLSTELSTENLQAGNIEYYFAMQTVDGGILTYPESNPEMNPLSFKLVASTYNTNMQSQEEIIILSPEPAEVTAQDELIIAVSIPNQDADIDHARTRLLIDGIDVSTLLERESNLYILIPSRMRTGSHNAEFKIYNASGSQVGKQEWSFRVSSGSTEVYGFKQRTNVFLDNRFQDISKESNNYFRAGFIWEGEYDNWDFKLRATGSSDDGFSGQNANRFGGLVAYNFNPQTRLYLRGGDFSGDYGELTFWNRRVFGVNVGLKSSYFDLDFATGITASAVEGEIDAAKTAPITPATSKTFGTYEESFLAIRPVFNFGDHISWGLNLLNGKEDPKSIKSELLRKTSTGQDTTIKVAANPTESLVLGTTLKLNFDNNRIRFNASVQASIANNNAAEEVDFDSLAEKFNLSGSDKKLAEKVADFFESTGFLSITQGLSPIPNLAMQFDTYLSYFNNYLKITYKNIDQNYVTPGNPYLIRGISGLFVQDNIRLLNNQVFLNLYYNTFTDNLSQAKAETDNSDLGVSISYFPMQTLPSLTLTFGNQTRKNDANPTDPSVNAEDNSTQRVTVSSNYSFFTGNVKNTATVSVSNVARDDKKSVNNSDFTLFSLALRNNLTEALTTRLGFTQTTSLFGEGSGTEVENKISRFYGGIEYLIKQFSGDMDFKPFAEFALNKIGNGVDYNRTNYSAGFLINSNDYGNLSLRYDYIDFGDLPGVDWQDTIISTRYDVTF